MRKVTFIIDDHAYFQRLYKLPPEQAKAMFSGTRGFRATYAIFSRAEGDTIPDRCELTDGTGEKIDLDSLNAFQRGVILGECMRYFEGELRDRKPTGVLEIKEENF
jgi:hypothetical protein